MRTKLHLRLQSRVASDAAFLWATPMPWARAPSRVRGALVPSATSRRKGVRLRDAGLALMTLAIAVNSAATFVASRNIRNLADGYRFALLMAIPRAAVGASRDTSEAPRDRGVAVELFWDFGCAFCRSSALAIDSVRRVFGDSVDWRFRHFANARNPLSMRAALAAACVPDGPWRLLAAIDTNEVWSDDALNHAIGRTGGANAALKACMRADSTAQRVWSDVFRAAASGKTATPTLIVDGITVSGKVQVEALQRLIQSRLNARGGVAAHGQ